LQRVTSASICCGAHAGDPASIRQTLRFAADCAVVIGAHPGFADRQGFGRREQVVTTGEVERLILEQVETLRILACEVDLPIRFLKPHGALYNQAQSQQPVAQGVLLAAGRLDIPLLGQPGTLLERLAREQGVRYIPEGFPDRRYRAPDALVPRTEPGAVLHDPDEIELQVIRLVAEGGPEEPMVARVGGEIRLAPGAPVVLSVSGTVHCWPRHPAGGTPPGPGGAGG